MKSRLVGVFMLKSLARDSFTRGFDSSPCQRIHRPDLTWYETLTSPKRFEPIGTGKSTGMERFVSISLPLIIADLISSAVQELEAFHQITTTASGLWKRQQRPSFCRTTLIGNFQSKWNCGCTWQLQHSRSLGPAGGITLTSTKLGKILQAFPFSFAGVSEGRGKDAIKSLEETISKLRRQSPTSYRREQTWRLLSW